MRRSILWVGAFLAVLALGAGVPAVAADGRPLLVTVDDLPISSTRLHPDPEERRHITEHLLAALERHKIRAVGLVTWDRVKTDADRELLRMWVEAGHELGNHSRGHLNYTRTDSETYIADVEVCRARLAEFLEPLGRSPRFFRFPMLREGDTPAKLAAMRDYLRESGQINLPPTIDNQDWSYEEPWVEARRAGDEARMEEIGADYLASLRIMTRHHERTGDELFGRELPQILLLHATEVGGARWDALFTWLAASGHRFATVDEVLKDPAFAEPHDYVGPLGLGLWDRLLFQRRLDQARTGIEAVLEEQMAAWNRGDVEAFCSHYAADCVFVSPSGMTHGRAELEERYRTRYPGKAAMGTLTLDILEWSPAAGVEVSLLGDARPSRIHGASLVARWTLSYPDQEAKTGLTLLVLRPRGDGWEVVQDASM